MEGPYRYTKTTAPTKHYGVSKQGKTPNVSESEKLTMRMIIVMKKKINYTIFYNIEIIAQQLLNFIEIIIKIVF